MFKSLKLYTDQHIELHDILARLVAFGYRRTKNVIQAGDFSQRGEVLDIFPVRFDGPIRVAFNADRVRSIDSFNIRSSKVIWHHKLAIILPNKISSSPKDFSSETPLNNFVDIRAGDYVVHHQYGIGKFLGISRLEVQNQQRDHFVIEYQGGDRLYVPEHDMHLIQKYIAFTKRPPRLFKLGSKEWRRIRLQIQKKIQRLAAELLHLQAMRASLKGHAFPADTDWQEEFESQFEFKETPDQTKSIREVKADMQADHPMDRLLCGDVGFGKTEVALRASFKAVMDNKQVALLVPTTILAEQHYYNFRKRLHRFPFTVTMLSRFRTAGQQAEIIKGLAAGTVDIVIGTHRLLSKDIVFKDLGLVIIDEEQRFGVKAKERLKHFKLLVDVLTMTATPIPRTLYMALSGAKDMSILSTPPQNRIPVVTHIVEFDEQIIQQAIQRELRRQGQVFFLHNRIEDIDHIARIVQKLVPVARVATAHGQMPARILEEIMLKFFEGQINVLVCTTIIESGIDIPNANTLIVNRADRFGLAELHQLRGRVGRFSNQAYAYFIVPPKQVMAKIARTRLQALEKYSELGCGFQIAFEDLQIRGAGNLLGQQQSGYISSVGFDLYCRLLKQSIEHLKHSKESAVDAKSSP